MIEELYSLSNGGRLEIGIDAIDSLISFRQDTLRKKEAGGVLLGRFIISSKDVVIDEVTRPMRGDKRTRFSFKRGLGHQKVVMEKWKANGCTTHYLGEWHSHPQDYPEPSNKDIGSWKEKLKTAIYSSRYLYFIIVGIKETHVWEGDRRNLKIRKLNRLANCHSKRKPEKI